MDSNQHILSVIVVALNEARHIARLKTSIDALRRPSSVTVETVLVDGGSSDGTAQRAQEAGFKTVLELPGANIPTCRNSGVRAAAGDWLAFVDGDCELAPDWLEQAAPLLRKEDRIVLGWPVSPPEPSTWVQDAWHAHWVFKNVHYEDLGDTRVIRQEGFRMVTTRNMLLHRTVWDAVGGFDEALETGEDTDFVFRAYQKGIAVLGLPTLKVVHHADPATWSAFFRQQLWHANRRSYRKIARHSGMKVGGRAPLYTFAFALALLGMAATPVLLAVTRSAWPLLLALPFAAITIGPAAVISRRARRPFLLLPLVGIYTAYGLARTADLLGLSPAKPSWKSPAAAKP